MDEASLRSPNGLCRHEVDDRHFEPWEHLRGRAVGFAEDPLFTVAAALERKDDNLARSRFNQPVFSNAARFVDSLFLPPVA